MNPFEDDREWEGTTDPEISHDKSNGIEHEAIFGNQTLNIMMNDDDSSSEEIKPTKKTKKSITKRTTTKNITKNITKNKISTKKSKHETLKQASADPTESQQTKLNAKINILKSHQNMILDMEQKNKAKFRSRKNIPVLIKTPPEKLTIEKKKLLDIYYNHQDECDHLWLDTPMMYLEPEQSQSQSQFDVSPRTLDEIYGIIDRYNTNDKRALIVHINSMGGHLDAGVLLYNLLKNMKKPTISVIEFVCASAATYPLLACDLRITKPYTFTLVHQHRSMSSGKFKEMRRQSFVDQKVYEQMIELYQRETKMSKSDLKSLIKRELFLNNSQLMNYGLIDHIFDPSRVPRLAVDKIAPGAVPKEITVRDLFSIKRFITDSKLYLEERISQIVVIIDYHRVNYLGVIEMINRLLEMPIPVTCVIPTNIVNGYFLFSLFTDYSTLMKNSTRINLVVDPTMFQGFPSEAENLEDKMLNALFYRHMIKTILQSRTKLPKAIIDEIPYKTFNFSAEECLKYGLISSLI